MLWLLLEGLASLTRLAPMRRDTWLIGTTALGPRSRIAGKLKHPSLIYEFYISSRSTQVHLAGKECKEQTEERFLNVDTLHRLHGLQAGHLLTGPEANGAQVR